MTIRNHQGRSVSYANESIETISFHKARELYSLEECAGNEVRPNEVLMHIAFRDGSEPATFIARNWCIVAL